MRVNYSKAKDLFGFKYAFYKHTRLAVLEKIKNKKKFSENNLYHRAKFFRKNFFTKKIEKRQRSSWCPDRGCVPSAHKAAQYRHVTDVLHVYCKRGKRGACRSRVRAFCIMYFEGRALFTRLIPEKSFLQIYGCKRPS